MTQWTVASLLARTTDYLAAKGSASSRLDAELLLAEVLEIERVGLYTQFDRPLTASELDAYRELVSRRARHEPVAYILSRAAFRYLSLEVSPAVLIPRPETEELVDAVLAWLRLRPLLPAPSPGSGPVIADVGTGSGAIALSLAREAGVRVLATDTDSSALAVAGRNRDALGLTGFVELREADLLSGVPPGSLRVVVANPPYVTDDELAELAPDVRLYEPASALSGGVDGLGVYRRLVPAAFSALGPGGAMFLEVGDTQAPAVRALAHEAGFDATEVVRDLSGKDRIVRGAKSGCVVLREGDLDGATTRALAAALTTGAVIGIPTDTVYGLAASWDSPIGVRRLFAAKGRGDEQPISVLFPSVEAVRAALVDLDESAARVLEELLPGPYTFVVATAVRRPELVGTVDSLGVRVPDHPSLLGFIGALGVPLAATSANLSGRPDVTGLAEADPAVLAHCAAALDLDRQGAAGVASTVVDLRPLARGEGALILREGAVSAAEVSRRVASV